MDFAEIFDSQIFSLIILPLLIFLARVVDVTLGTLRIIFLSRGMKYLAPIFGFFEILIWILALGQIMHNLTNLIYYIAYAGGFSMGIFIGMYIEEKLALGKAVVQIITQKDASELIDCLKACNYGVTNMDANGVRGQVKIVYTVVKRKDIPTVMGHLKKCNPNAFFSITEVRNAEEGVFPVIKNNHKKRLFGFNLRRK